MDNQYSPEELLRQAIGYRQAIERLKSMDIQSSYAMTMSKIRSRERRARLVRTFRRTAAILLLPLIVATLALSVLLLNEREAPVARIETTTLEGMISKIYLPDSTIVVLNSHSKVSYPAVFRKNQREVALQGEGFFEVKSDAKHPFYVNLDNGLCVMAHGTRFNISSYHHEKNVEIMLERGGVNVLREGRTISEMSPGELLTYDKSTGTFRKKRADVREICAWKEDKLCFKNASLDEVFKILGRRFNAKFIIHQPKHMKYRIRATFENERLNDILDDLKRVVPIKWANEAGSSDAKCRVIHIY